MTKGHNVIFTHQGVYLTENSIPNAYAKFIRERVSDNLYTLSSECTGGISSPHANPAIIKAPANAQIHEFMNHANS